MLRSPTPTFGWCDNAPFFYYSCTAIMRDAFFIISFVMQDHLHPPFASEGREGKPGILSKIRMYFAYAPNEKWSIWTRSLWIAWDVHCSFFVDIFEYNVRTHTLSLITWRGGSFTFRPITACLFHVLHRNKRNGKHKKNVYIRVAAKWVIF